MLFYAMFALGLNVLVGYGGLVSLGHAGLFGIAGYVVGYVLAEGFARHARNTCCAGSCRAAVDRCICRPVAARHRHRG